MLTGNGLRDRKKLRTREAIVQAAYELFLEKGYDSTTMDDVAARAEVSRSTLFRYFGSKEALVFPHQDRRLGMFTEILHNPLPGEAPFANARRALLRLAEEFWQARRELRLQQRIVAGSPLLQAREMAWYDEWELAIRRALVAACRNETEQSHRARLAAGAMFAIVRTTMLEWLRRGCRENLVELAGQEMELIEQAVQGLAPFLLKPGRGKR